MAVTLADALTDFALLAVEGQQALHDEAGETQWEADLDQCRLWLGERPYDVAMIGTSSEISNTWMWSWANPGYGASHPAVSAILPGCAKGREAGIPEFAVESFSLDGVTDYGMRPGSAVAFLAARLSGAPAMYAAPGEDGATRAGVRSGFGATTPQTRPGDAQVEQDLPQQGQGQADHIVWISLDTCDKCATQPVDGECASHPAGFAARHVGGDLLIRDIGELHHRARGTQCLPGLVVATDQHEMSRVQYALAASHPPPLRSRGFDGTRFSMGASLELQHGIAGDEDGIARDPLGNRFPLRGRQPKCESHGLRIGDQGFVYLAGLDLGI